MKKHLLSVILGVVIIAVGLAYVGDVLGLWALDISFPGWWTLFIIIPCALSLFAGGLNILNCVGLFIGILFLLTEQGILQNNLGYRLVFPIIIVAIGVAVLFGRLGSKTEGNSGVFAGNNGDNYFAVIGSSVPQFAGQPFRGASSFAIFGYIELRLTNAIVKRDCMVKAFSIFGGTDIYLPENVRLVVYSMPIFGGVENGYVNSASESAPTVYVRALSIFGSIKIK